MYLDLEKRAALTSVKNNKGQTPLHVLAATSPILLGHGEGKEGKEGKGGKKAGVVESGEKGDARKVSPDSRKGASLLRSSVVSTQVMRGGGGAPSRM